MTRALRAPALLGLLCAAACTVGGEVIELPASPAGTDAASVFDCDQADATACEGATFLYCVEVGEGEFLDRREQDCAADGKVCIVDRGCLTCAPDATRCVACPLGADDCSTERIERCRADGSGWEPADRCDPAAGEGCFQGQCVDLCQRAESTRSYEGCTFYAADLDNAAIDVFNDASSQQFAVVVANPFQFPVGVRVEINEAPFGQTPAVTLLEQRDIPAGGLETLKLPRREVDGSSETGLNDGTHTALTSHAFRIVASHPITAYQFNPLDNVNVFSNDAALLLPTSALSGRYTVVGWPQTIGDSDNPEDDFDPTVRDEDLRAFLTVVGTQPNTTVTLTMGPHVGHVFGAGSLPALGPGGTHEIEIGPFDVINLESDGKDGDFTGSRVQATGDVAVFTGSEASDVPAFSTYAERRCCADHLEEQLLPDSVLGTIFTIARMPPRTQALAAAAAEGDPLGVAIVDELEWVRIVAPRPGTTRITTSLPPPNDSFDLAEGQDAMLEVSRDFVLRASQAVSVLQALPSQAQTGIPRQFPGGDPAIVVVPPAEQYRSDYIFLTPDKYAFDFVTIVASPETRIELDGAPLSFYRCDTADVTPLADGVPQVVHRCQLSFPEVSSGAGSVIEPGNQNDGRHILRASSEVGVVVYGFDRFVSYAYAAGLDLLELQ